MLINQLTGTTLEFNSIGHFVDQRALLNKIVRYGKGMSLGDIEELSNVKQLSKNYIIPHGRSLTKPYALVFYTCKDRPGAHQEALTVMRALEQMRMTVYANIWESFDVMRESLADRVSSINDTCSFLLVSIMAHGFKGHVVGEDGSRGQLNDLIGVVDLELKPFIPVVRTCARLQFIFW